jgi:predicted regulator of amino acid metabolism with ACT domain
MPASGAGINIEGSAAWRPRRNGGSPHLGRGRHGHARALQNAGLEVSDERDPIVVDVEDRPGTVAQVAGKVADAGVNIELAYATFGGGG